jgi:Ser/Thr protein kinase RdoA (MazF antagonist)
VSHRNEPNGTIIGEGRTADILAWDDGYVLKLYKEGWSREYAEYEARIAHIVHGSGAAAPAVGELVEVDGRMGLVYERVVGPTLEGLIQRAPWNVAHYGRMLADLHAAMHRCPAGGLPDQRARLEKKLDEVALSYPNVAAHARRALSKLPSGDRLCHGDFHTQNVILSQRGPVVLDWIDATCGHPHADVARTLVLLRNGYLHVPPGPLRAASRIAIAVMVASYLGRYVAATGAARGRIMLWLAPVAAARLVEGIEVEKAALIRVARRGS